MRPVKLPFYAKLCMSLLSIVMIVIILIEARDILVPLVFSLLIAILLYPFNRFLQDRLNMGRAAAAMISVLVFISSLVSFIYFLAIEIIGFSSDFPILKTRLTAMFGSLQHWLSYKLHITNHQQSEYINKSVNSIMETIARSLSNIFSYSTGILLSIVFMFIFTFFILFHRKLLMKFILHLFSLPYRDKVKEVIMETKNMIKAYVLGLVIEMALVGVVNTVMFMIMGIQYAVLLGVMAAVLNIIPYLGIYTAIGLTMLVTFANSTGNLAIEAGIGLFCVHLIDSNILFPRIIGGQVKMNPFITIIAVIIGEYIWGVSGMFLFIPITGILKLVFERVEGMEAWGMLIGVEDVEKKPKKIKLKDLPKDNEILK